MKLVLAIIEPHKIDEAREALGQIHAAHTGSIGDGKMFVIDVEQAVRIRTGDVNNDAL